MRLVCFVVLAVVVAGPAGAQVPGETIDIGGWKVHNDRNGDGSQTCVALWQFDDKSMIGFGADTNKVTYLIISEPEAGLTRSQQVQIKYRVDSGKPKTAMGVATSKEMVVVPINDPDTDFTAFQAGNKLVADFGGDSYEEPLAGSSNAIKALAECIGAAIARK